MIDDCDTTVLSIADTELLSSVWLLSGYFVNMPRPDVALAYSELSKCVQSPGASHMDASHHVFHYLRGTHDKSIRYSRDNRDNVCRNTLWG